MYLVLLMLVEGILPTERGSCPITDEDLAKSDRLDWCPGNMDTFIGTCCGGLGSSPIPATVTVVSSSGLGSRPIPTTGIDGTGGLGSSPIPTTGTGGLGSSPIPTTGTGGLGSCPIPTSGTDGLSSCPFP